jgi:hypothetical protein
VKTQLSLTIIIGKWQVNIKYRIKQIVKNFIATDSEWDATSGEWISTAFYGKAQGAIVVFTKNLPPKTKRRLFAHARKIGAFILFLNRDDDLNLYERVAKYGDKKKQQYLVMFFSPKDIEYAFGWKTALKAYQKTLNQRNNITGRIGKTKIKDLKGLAGKKTLNKFTRDLGITMDKKSKLDDYKTNMLKGVVEMPETYLEYCVDDAKVLITALETIVKSLNDIKSTLGIDKQKYWTAETLPTTTGTLVSTLLKEWIEAQTDEYNEVFQYCLRKVGILATQKKNNDKTKEAFNKCFDTLKTIEDFKQASESDDLKTVTKAKYLSTALDNCSVRHFAAINPNQTACFNALVHGGRCNNEDPHHYRIERGLDIDIQSCYGTIQRKVKYPVGVPTVWNYTTNQNTITFGNWYKQNKEQLVDGLWTATVSGELTFEQDLLVSKLVKPKDIGKACRGGSKDDDTAIPTDTVLLRRQIKNAIITSDLMEILLKTCSNQELKQFNNLKLITACAYQRKNQCHSVKEWCEAVLQSDEKFYATEEAVYDLRCQAWFGFNFENFVGKMVEERKKWKAITDSPQAEGMDNLLKLLINTVYGVMSSRFFKISNTVVANNITAKARAGVWMLAKALGLKQTITDGGIYCPEQVLTFNTYKPSIEKLAQLDRWLDKNKYRTYKKLGDYDWKNNWSNLPPVEQWDKFATEHVIEFWKQYDLTFDLELHHKQSFLVGAYTSKADNALRLNDGTTEYKIRGKERKVKEGRKLHPTYLLLDNIIDGKDDFPQDLTYTKGGIQTINQYLQAANSTHAYKKFKDLRPGDNIPETLQIAKYNNLHMPIQSEKEFTTRKNRKTVDHNKKTLLFEKYSPEGWHVVHQQMLNNDLKRKPIQ